jgi:hypothetical protein
LKVEQKCAVIDFCGDPNPTSNTVEMSEKLNELAQEGYVLTKDELAALSPYQTQRVKRFGQYELDLQTLPPPITDDLLFEIISEDNSLPLLETQTSAAR